jgi:hypothetical protein
MSICVDAGIKARVPVTQPAQKQQIHKNKTLEQTKQKYITGKGNIKEVLGQKL